MAVYTPRKKLRAIDVSYIAPTRHKSLKEFKKEIRAALLKGDVTPKMMELAEKYLTAKEISEIKKKLNIS